MSSRATFDEVLDAVERLSPEQQADLLQVIKRRLADRARQQVVQDARDARAQFDSGGAKRASVDEIVREIQS
jgi:hypothetical protein